MHHHLLIFLLLTPSISALALTSAYASIPSESLRISPSTDGTCGGIDGYTCDSSTLGNCCSLAGWCGSTTAYCLVVHGCQSSFGSCIDGAANPNITSPSYDGMCGGTLSCSGGPWDGACCSGAGFCGYGDEYCQADNGCQRGLGTCREVSVDGTCGGSTGYSCVGSGFGDCCSEAGWCGSDALHCGPRCQGSVGPCLAPTPDGSCGIERGFTCLNSTYGECCSSAGFCGNTAEYCSTNAGCNVGAFNNPALGVCLIT